MNKTAKLCWYCKPSGAKHWSRFPVVTYIEPRSGAVRVKHGVVMIDGKEVTTDNGRFQLRTCEGSKVVYTTLRTDDPVKAYDEYEKVSRKMKHAAALAMASDKGTVKVWSTVKAAVDDYVSDLKHRQKFETAKTSRRYLDKFVRVLKLPLLTQVTRKDVLPFQAALRKDKMSERTIHNATERVRGLAKFVKLKWDIPPVKYEKKLPKTYKTDVLTTLLANADTRTRLLIELGLKCGLRRKEIAHLEWNDIDFERSTLSVTSKPHWNWSVKTQEQRKVPLPSDLLVLLKAWRDERPLSRLVLPTRRGKPDHDILNRIKRSAIACGLNPKDCDVHSLRRSYITQLLRSGVDVATVMRFAGHSQLATVQKYARPHEAEEMVDTLSGIKWT